MYTRKEIKLMKLLLNNVNKQGFINSFDDFAQKVSKQFNKTELRNYLDRFHKKKLIKNFYEDDTIGDINVDKAEIQSTLDKMKEEKRSKIIWSILVPVLVTLFTSFIKEKLWK